MKSQLLLLPLFLLNMAETNSIPRVLFKILNLLIFSSRIGKGKGEGEGEVEKRRCRVAQMEPFCLHQNATELQNQTLAANMKMIFKFWTFLPKKLKLLFSAEEQEKLRRKIGEASILSLSRCRTADKLANSFSRNNLDIYLTPFDPSHSQTPGRQANAAGRGFYKFKESVNSSVAFPGMLPFLGQEIVLTADLPSDLDGWQKAIWN